LHLLFKRVDPPGCLIPSRPIGVQLPLKMLVLPAEELRLFLEPLILFELHAIHDTSKLPHPAKSHAWQNLRRTVNSYKFIG
jgi:hypothetical protein